MDRVEARVGPLAPAFHQSGGPAVAGRRLVRDCWLEAERRLPLPGTVQVAVLDEVEPDTVVAVAPNAPAQLHVIQLGRAFGGSLDPAEVEAALLKRPGDPVRAGEAVARIRRPGWFEEEKLEATSPAAGVVEFVSAGRGQVVVRSQTEARDERIALPVARHLGLEPAELPGHALCRPGQTVVAGDVLARATGLRLLGSEYKSPMSGTVESISPLTGSITLVRQLEPILLRAYMAGTVARVTAAYGVTILARGHRVFGVLGLGGKCWGRLVEVGDRDGRGGGGTEPRWLAAEHSGAVLLVPGEVGAEFLRRAREAGARGVIAGSARASELALFLGHPLAGEIVTGPGALALRDEPGGPAGGGAGFAPGPGLTVIITEGLGHLAMDGEVLATLREHLGQVASLDGLTQIRAGVVRPSVLLVKERPDLSQPGASPQGDRDGPPMPPPPPVLQAGMRVRLVRRPYFGLWGTVVEEPRGLSRLETEVEARVLVVLLDDGRRVRVAEANVEL